MFSDSPLIFFMYTIFVIRHPVFKMLLLPSLRYHFFMRHLPAPLFFIHAPPFVLCALRFYQDMERTWTSNPLLESIVIPALCDLIWFMRHHLLLMFMFFNVPTIFVTHHRFVRTTIFVMATLYFKYCSFLPCATPFSCATIFFMRHLLAQLFFVHAPPFLLWAFLLYTSCINIFFNAPLFFFMLIYIFSLISNNL